MKSTDLAIKLGFERIYIENTGRYGWTYPKSWSYLIPFYSIYYVNDVPAIVEDLDETLDSFFSTTGICFTSMFTKPKEVLFTFDSKDFTKEDIQTLADRNGLSFHDQYFHMLQIENVMNEKNDKYWKEKERLKQL